MDNLISRQAAIDALQKEINKCKPPFDDVIGSIRCGVRLARNIIEDLPSAQPEYYDYSDIEPLWKSFAEENDINLTDTAKQAKDAMWCGYKKGKADAQPTEASCWGCNCPKMERLKKQKTFSEMVHLHDAVEAIEGLPPAQPKPCEDAVSRADVLECFADLYDTFEDCSKGIINELHRKFEDLRTLPSAQSDRSLWFRIGEICVDESKGFISAGRAVEKIRELMREAERREE